MKIHDETPAIAALGNWLYNIDVLFEMKDVLICSISLRLFILYSEGYII